jgi:tetratricopeptide (TPR) repeat protein
LRKFARFCAGSRSSCLAVAPLARSSARAAREVEDDLFANDWFSLACDLEACDAGQARDAYRRALELDPTHVDARVNLGRLLHDAGEIRAAEAHYRLALAARPEHPTASFNLGVALQDLGRKDDALKAYKWAIKCDPNCADAHYNIAQIYEATGKSQSALKHLARYRELTRVK